MVLDTETTGLSFSKEELIQIAAARVSGGKIVDWYVTFVDPGKEIPEEISHLTNIFPQDVAGAPTPQEALSGLVEFVGDSFIVAHNAEFDKTFTTAHPEGYPLLENVWIDSLDLARIALPRLKAHRLLDLVRAFDAPISTHRADADVEATAAVLRILLAGIEAMPAALVEAIASAATVREWSTSAVFKYFAQGKPADEQAFLSEMQTELAGFCLVSDEELPAYKRLQLRTLRYKAQPVPDKKLDAELLAQDPLFSFKTTDAQEIQAAFTPDGVIGGLYEHFEKRSAQEAMAEAVAHAFAQSENLVVEAGTGVGKSMAYLLPAALLAKNNGITVGVATKTNTLLDQLMYHELPALSAALGGLRYAAIKGYTHYPCLRKIQNLLHSGKFMKPAYNGKEMVCMVPGLAILLSFIEQTDYDDMDALKLDYKTLQKSQISSSSQECFKRKCPFSGTSCFVHGARHYAENADIIVTNHSLLFCDVAADGMLLPPVRHWIIDEAHGAEHEAREAFSKRIPSEELLAIASHVAGEEASKNMFDRCWRRFVAVETETSDTLVGALCEKCKRAGRDFEQSVDEYTHGVKSLLFFDEEKNKSYEFVDIWINDTIRYGDTFKALSQQADAVIEAAEKLVSAAQSLVGALDEYEQLVSEQREVALVVMQLKDVIDACETFFHGDTERYAFSATLSHKKERLTDTLAALPYDMASLLDEHFYEQTHATVYASATLSVGKDFRAFENSLGLNSSEASAAKSIQLQSSFDFDNNMIIYVPNDIPEPSSRNYMTQLQAFLTDLHIAQRGSMLTLFTNRREMEQCFEAVQPQLNNADLRLVCQKKGVSVKALRDEFVSNEQLSLVALKSFWEGFDAPGAPLRGVVIPKLPFSKPSDPLSRERALRDSEAWNHYVLPAAVIETKQAAGRLIRTEHDKGILVLADHRLLSKNYGKAFLNSMPSKTIKIMSCEEIVREVERMNREGN